MLDPLRFDGAIAGAAFAGGDRIVVGCWPRSPFGPFVDVMWARPDGSRVLIAPDRRIASFVEHHYGFDEVRCSPTGAWVGDDALTMTAGPLRLHMQLRSTWISHLLRARPRSMAEFGPWLWTEDTLIRPVAAAALGLGGGVRMRGRTRAGARERYAILDLRLATLVRASDEGRELGPPARPGGIAGFGFSEFPAIASLVRVTSLIEDR